MSSLKQLPRTLFNRQWWWVTILVILGVIVLARLGFWQLDRLEERRAANALLAAQLDQPPIDLNNTTLPAGPEELEDRWAEADGEYDFSQQIILTQQRWQGSLGVRLVTPLLLEGSDEAVLVDRGWVPLEVLNEDRLAEFKPEGQQRVVGQLQGSQTLFGDRSAPSIVPDSDGRQWYRIDIAAIEEELPYELLPLYLLQSPVDQNANLPFRNEAAVDLSDGPHLSYAIQWFIFCAFLGLGYLRFVSQRSKP